MSQFSSHERDVSLCKGRTEKQYASSVISTAQKDINIPSSKLFFLYADKHLKVMGLAHKQER